MSTEQQAFSFLRSPQPAPKPQTIARRNLVIDAGAGTGKTTAIVGEVLKLLLGPQDIAPERIVLVTFTEKAAGEIADRIHAALEELGQQMNAGEPLRWPADSEHPVFKAGAEERSACEAAIGRQLARIDNLRSQTIHAFCQSLLRQYPIEAGIDPQFRILEGFDRSRLYDAVYDGWIDDETRVKHDADAAHEWDVLLQQCTWMFKAKEHLFALLERRHLLSETRYEIGSIAEYERTILDAIQTVCERGPSHPITAYFRATPPPAPGSSIDAWIDYFAPIADDLRKVYLKDFKGCSAAFKAVLRGEDTKSCIYDRLLSHRAAAAAIALARRFIARLDAEKRRRGLLDFDDLLLLTRRLLDHRSVLERIRDQFDFIFVDEFQDTDRVQAEILELLASDDGGRFVPGKIAVVGDPKQSIYAFRRADPETYARFTQALLDQGAARQLLVDQYRSTPEIVHELNTIGPQLFTIPPDEKDPNVFSPEYHELAAARKKARGGNPVAFIAADGDPEHEAEAIVEWIRAKGDGDLRRFALLFRRKTYIDVYLDVFDRRKLAYVVPPLGVFLESPAAVDLLAVLRSVAYSYDLGARISAARSPYFALTDAEIASGIAGGSGPWTEVADSLEAFRRAAAHLTVTDLIDHIVTTSGIESVYRETGDSRALRNLEQVRAVAFTYDRKAGGSLRQFVEEIARRRDTPEEVEPSLLDETTNAVRILTIHGAKGLEFETVILPDLEFPGGGTGLDLFTVEEPPTLVLRNGLETLSGICRFSDNRPLKEIGPLRDKAELRRLFYVAVTRAKSEIAFVTRHKPDRKGFGKFVHLLFPERLPAPDALPEQPVAEAVAVGPGPLAPCAVPQPAEVVELMPREEVAIARRGSANRAAGILLHRVLERWDGTSDAAPLIAGLALEQAADERAIDLVRGRVAQIAGSEVFRRIMAAETIGREMPVAFIDASGSLVERRVDRVVRENGIDLVIDYKSGEPSPARVERDREQVALYCKLLGDMHGRPCRGLLWYIDAENDVAIDVM